MAGLGDVPVAAVLRAEDFDRASKFYTEVLGLRAIPSTGPTREGMFAAGEGTVLTIYERPEFPAPQNTTLSFGVPPKQFDLVIGHLRAAGIRLEDYDIPELGLKTENGIATFENSRAAWFKDSEGNIISVGTM
jgi:catechol-2,3-dioxygenase